MGKKDMWKSRGFCLLILIVCFTGCTSVKKDSFIQPVDNFTAGKIEFSENNIHVNIDYIQDSLIQSQIYQVIDPKVKTYNSTCNLSGNTGKLLLRINQGSMWEGLNKKISFAITGEIYDESQKVLLQQTVLVTGKDSIVEIKNQRKYILPLIKKLIRKWKKITPLEDK